VDIGASRVLLAKAGGAQRVGQPRGELANLDSELTALLARRLVLAKRAVDLPVDLSQRSEHRDPRPGLDRPERVRRHRAQPVIRVAQATLGAAQPGDDPAVLLKQR
jgi:hypothetical protein